jgi:hypothetical protein
MKLNSLLIMSAPMLNNEICKKLNKKNDTKNEQSQYRLTC